MTTQTAECPQSPAGAGAEPERSRSGAGAFPGGSLARSHCLARGANVTGWRTTAVSSHALDVEKAAHKNPPPPPLLLTLPERRRPPESGDVIRREPPKVGSGAGGRVY